MPQLNIHDWLKLIGILVGCANIAVIIYIAMRTASAKALDDLNKKVAVGDKKANQRIDGFFNVLPTLHQRDSDMHTRISVLETRVANMPTHADLKAIERQLSNLTGQVSTVSDRSETTLGMVRSIQEHLIEGGR